METIQCLACDAPIAAEHRTYLDTECGVPNVYLQGVEIAECSKCDDSQVILPNILKVHNSIALALLKSPRQLTGPQFKFLRKHAEISREQFAKYLGTETEEILKWEQDEAPISQSADRLARLVVVELAPDLVEFSPAVARNLSEISNILGNDMEIHVDVNTLTFAYTFVKKAA
jgi:DNA-binding transcriptional regulator YiaG